MGRLQILAISLSEEQKVARPPNTPRSVGPGILYSTVALVVLVALPASATSVTERISVGPRGAQSSDFGVSATASVSSSGRFIAFESVADNLVPSDTNDNSDVFLRDRKAGITRRMSLGGGGVQGDGPSRGAVVAAGGRYVGFGSLATNLVGGDTNGHWDAFVRDRSTSSTQRVSVSSEGAEGNADSFLWTISEGGRFVVMVSDASNLVPGDTNGAADVFLRDRKSGTTSRISVGAGGVQANGNSSGADISANGRFVTFESDASNLVAGDTNGSRDIFLRDLRIGITTLVSRGRGGLPANGMSFDAAISANGRYVAYHSAATNLASNSAIPGVFVYDRQTGSTERLPRSDDGSAPAISSDGRFVAFYSGDDTIVPGDDNETNDVFLRDRLRGTTRLMSVARGGGVGNGSSEAPAVSADGSTVAFESEATDLVSNDTNYARDVFARVKP